jgi:heterotetrameric sarcosine oxidase delta subunit
MHRIACPFCGVRDDIEFRYRGDASLMRPGVDAAPEAFAAFVFERANPAGWHIEWWQHVHGCRATLKVRRHTVTHEIGWIGRPHEMPPPLDEAAS